MKATIGLIFLFAVINVSLSSTLRELDFIKGLYPHEDIPKPLVTSLINRRIDQVRTLCERESIGKDATTFLNTTDQSLQLLLEAMDSNYTQIGYFLENYSQIVGLMEDVSYNMEVPNFDYLHLNLRSSFDREELQNLIDAYIGDIEMVRMCEVSLGRSDRVDMNTFDRIKSLSNQLRNFTFYRDDRYFTDSYNICTKTIDLCLWQLKFLLNQFTAAFTNPQV